MHNIVLRLIKQHHKHLKEEAVTKLLHKLNTSDRFYNKMRKNEQSTKTTWNVFVNKVKDLLSPKQSEKAILDTSVVKRM